MFRVLDTKKIREFLEKNANSESLNIRVLDRETLTEHSSSLDSCLSSSREVAGASYAVLVNNSDDQVGRFYTERGSFTPKSSRFGPQLGYEAIYLEVDTPFSVYTYLHGQDYGKLAHIDVPAGSIKLWASIFGSTASVLRRDHIEKEVLGHTINFRLAGDDVPFFEQIPSYLFLSEQYSAVPVNPEPIRFKDKIRNVFYNPSSISKE